MRVVVIVVMTPIMLYAAMVLMTTEVAPLILTLQKIVVMSIVK